MKKRWLAGAFLVLAGGCDVVLGIEQAPPLQENQECRRWQLTGKTWGYVNEPQDTSCAAGSGQCDGAGTCKTAFGGQCGESTECARGFCVDSVCCDSACTETCKTCSSGYCSNVPLHSQDENPESSCVGVGLTCNGNGSCLKDNGQLCGNGTECATGFCADGVCCDSACTETCKTCNAAGACTTITSGTDDSADQPCTGVQSCNGFGACKTEIGAPCSNSSECESGHCADGVCCNQDCSGTCMSCNLPNAAGTCSKTPSGQPDLDAAQPCGASGDTCDGFGNCKFVNGHTCSGQGECLTGNCVDGVCCDTACSGVCQACNLNNAVGTCSLVPWGQDDLGTCSGTIQSCDGGGVCKKDNGQMCSVNSECVSGNCVDGVCCNTACAGACQACNLTDSVGTCSNVPFGQDDIGTCSAQGQSCNGAGACKKDNGQTCSTSAECTGNVCAGIYGCAGRSCDGLANCTGGSCCMSTNFSGGTYNRANSALLPANVSKFRLDAFEVTVGRFRKFVDAYPGSKPGAGAGAHPKIPDSGWNSAWDSNLPTDRPALKMELNQCGASSTWTDNADPVTDNRPINCVSWELAFAFCAWDGNRLPTEAEWNYAAAHGTGQLVYPWSDNTINKSYAVFDCANGGDPTTCTNSAIPAVHSCNPPSNFWTGYDLAGSMAEWTLDRDGAYPASCNDCANLTNGTGHVARGGSWRSPWNKSSQTWTVPELMTMYRSPTTDLSTLGIRCAGSPPQP